MKNNHTNRISLSCLYGYAFRTWPLYEWSVKVSTTHSAVEISRKPPPPHLPLIHIHRDYTEQLSFRKIKHSEFLIKMNTLYLISNQI